MNRIPRWRVAPACAFAVFAVAIGAAGAPTFDPPTLPRAHRPPSFTKDVAPLVFKHCSPCHRPGGSAPFNLLTYQEVRDRAPLVAASVEQRRMPPWLPEPGYGDFVGARWLSDDEIALIRRWVDEGATEGDPAHLPPAPEWNDEWVLGTPDLIVSLPSYVLPAGGRDVYRNLVSSIPLHETRYVRAVEIRPGDPRVVHHARMMIDATPSSRAVDAQDAAPGFDGMDLESNATNPEGFFVGWTPGKIPKPGGDDMAWRLEPGTDLVLQLHLRPTGKPEAVSAQVGFYFAERAPRRIPALIMLGSYEIDIPPGDANYLVTDEYEVPVDVEVLSVYPHAHYLGKEMQGFGTLPNGKTEWLIRIRDWDFNWQDDYRYVEPIALPAGTVLSMRYSYDNSSENPQNPNSPPERVVYGSRSSDEMADLIVQVSLRDPDDRELLVRDLAWKDEVSEINYVARKEYLRGNLLSSQGRFGEAAAHYREALKLRSDDAKVYTGLVRALLALGEPDGAVLIAERAAQLTDNRDPHVLDQLATAYHAVGRTGRAVQVARRALTLAVKAGKDDLAEAIRQRLEQYERTKQE